MPIPERLLTCRVQNLPTPPHPACTRAVSSKATPQCPSVLTRPSAHESQLWKQEVKGRHRKGTVMWAQKLQLPPAACRSQHTPWMCSSACGITAGTGKEEAAGLQWDCRPGVCNGMCLCCCQPLSPRSSVPLEQRIIAKADKQPWANTAICSSSLTPSKSNMTFPMPLSLPGGTDPPKAQQAQPCSQPFPLPAAASARSQHQTPLQ